MISLTVNNNVIWSRLQDTIYVRNAMFAFYLRSYMLNTKLTLLCFLTSKCGILATRAEEPYMLKIDLRSDNYILKLILL